MAEAEDVITDAARHATVFTQRLWRTYRAHRPLGREAAVQAPELADVLERIELLLAAALGREFAIRPAQPPPRPTLLRVLAERGYGPRHVQAVPATDGARLWLPPRLPGHDAESALATWRACALQQGMRALRGAASRRPGSPAARDVHLVLEALSADAALVAAMPGLAPAIAALRAAALRHRPPIAAFPASRRPLEAWLRARLAEDAAVAVVGAGLGRVADTRRQALALLAPLGLAGWPTRAGAPGPLLKDAWSGELLAPQPVPRIGASTQQADVPASPDACTRSARLSRRPQVRQAPEDEDDRAPGAWMVQAGQPNEHVEDPYGMQRPTDRDEHSAADDFADSLAELPEARLVSTPGRPKEVLMSDDPPESRTRPARAAAAPQTGVDRIRYPEWDWRTGAYREPGATVLLLPCAAGPRAWVERTLDAHRGMPHAIRRRFEMLRAQRARLRRQDEGDDVDLCAWIDARADFAAGLPMPQGVYRSTRPATRDVALVLLIDVSGSTDAWVAGQRRIIDVAREALLLVAIALDGLGEPHAMLAFSGEGPGTVTVRTVKAFDERLDGQVEARIAGLEPEHYTRAGAAIRHATALLMRHPARHRLLLLLSDGRPNDIDEYEGRYGVEDMRQAVLEASLQGAFPFCLAVDRQAAGWLPRVFGAGRHARLIDPVHLPLVLLDWIRRLVSA